MTDRDLIKYVINNLNWCASLLNQAINIKHPRMLKGGIKDPDVSLQFLIKNLNYLGYHIVIMENKKYGEQWLLEYTEEDE